MAQDPTTMNLSTLQQFKKYICKYKWETEKHNPLEDQLPIWILTYRHKKHKRKRAGADSPNVDKYYKNFHIQAKIQLQYGKCFANNGIFIAHSTQTISSRILMSLLHILNNLGTQFSSHIFHNIKFITYYTNRW